LAVGSFGSRPPFPFIVMTTLLFCLLAFAVSALLSHTPREFSEIHYARRGWRQADRARFVIWFRVIALLVVLAIIGILYVFSPLTAEARTRRDSVRRVQFSSTERERDTLHYVYTGASVTREQVLSGGFGAARPRQSGGAR
jgi:hypothetical protein